VLADGSAFATVIAGSREGREGREVREETRRTATTFFLLLFFAPFAIVAPFA
jgi:hypothetical protein